MAQEKNDGVTIFQWKSYGDFSQNYPFAMGFDGHHLSLTKFDPDWQKDRKHRITKVRSCPTVCALHSATHSGNRTVLHMRAWQRMAACGWSHASGIRAGAQQ